MLTLMAANGADKGRIFDFPEDESRVIGRGSGPRCLMDNTASRMHAEVTCRDGRWYINDLQSTNGTFINGQRIAAETAINEGDRIQLGCTQLVASTANNDATIAGNIALVHSDPYANLSSGENASSHPMGSTPRVGTGHDAPGSTEIALPGHPNGPPAVYVPGGSPAAWLHPTPPPKQASTIGRWLVGLTAAVVVYFAIDVYLQHQQESDHYLRSILSEVRQPASLKPDFEEKIDTFIADFRTIMKDKPGSGDEQLLSQVHSAVQTQQAKQNAQEQKLQEILIAVQNQSQIDEQKIVDRLRDEVLADKSQDKDKVLTQSLTQVQNQLQQLLKEVNALKAQNSGLSHRLAQAERGPTAPPIASTDSQGWIPLMGTEEATANERNWSHVNPPQGSSLETPSIEGVEGIEANALSQSDRVVFLVDASGSLIDSMPRVIDEVNHTVAQLKKNQKFSVIFYQRNDVIEVPPGGLKAGSKQMKEEVEAWIRPSAGHVLPRGSSNPLDALRLAISYDPDLIYLCSDTITGDRPGEISQHQLMQELSQLNKGRRTKINTVQFFYDDPQQTLKTIAFEHGGVYRFVEEPQPAQLPEVPDLHSDILSESPGTVNPNEPDELVDDMTSLLDESR